MLLWSNTPVLRVEDPPDYWSPEQALAVYEFLDELRERVWDRYGEQITERMRFEYEEQQKRAQLELFPFNDEIPF